MKVSHLHVIWPWAVQAAEELEGKGPRRQGCPEEAELPQEEQGGLWCWMGEEGQAWKTEEAWLG